MPEKFVAAENVIVKYANGSLQPLCDVVEVGTLVDDYGDDIEILGVFVSVKEEEEEGR